MLVIITLILFTAALLQIVQKFYVSNFTVKQNEIDLAYSEFHRYIFQVIITISTLGYENELIGAITKILLIFIIIISLSIIPSKSSKLVSILSSKSVYARQK